MSLFSGGQAGPTYQSSNSSSNTRQSTGVDTSVLPAVGTYEQNLTGGLSDYLTGGNLPSYPTSDMYAPFNPQQQQGFDLASSNVGNWQPAMNAAQNFFTSAGGVSPAGMSSDFLMRALSLPSASTAAAPYMAQADQSIPSIIDQYMNPYMENVTNRYGTLAGRDFSQNILPTLNNQFAGATFGRDNYQNMLDHAIRDVTQNTVDQQGAALAAGYNTAGTQAATDLARYGQLASTAGSNATSDINSMISGAGTAGNIGASTMAGYTNLGNSQANLGTAIQRGGTQDLANLLTSGNQQQGYQNQQNAFTASQIMQNYPQYLWPTLNAILTGMPLPTLTQGSTNTSSSGTVYPGAQAGGSDLGGLLGLGLGIAGLGTGGGSTVGGGILSALGIGRAAGGRVGNYADGGPVDFAAGGYAPSLLGIRDQAPQPAMPQGAPPMAMSPLMPRRHRAAGLHAGMMKPPLINVPGMAGARPPSPFARGGKVQKFGDGGLGTLGPFGAQSQPPLVEQAPITTASPTSAMPRQPDHVGAQAMDPTLAFNQIQSGVNGPTPAKPPSNPADNTFDYGQWYNQSAYNPENQLHTPFTDLFSGNSSFQQGNHPADFNQVEQAWRAGHPDQTANPVDSVGNMVDWVRANNPNALPYSMRAANTGALNDVTTWTTGGATGMQGSADWAYNPNFMGDPTFLQGLTEQGAAIPQTGWDAAYATHPGDATAMPMADPYAPNQSAASFADWQALGNPSAPPISGAPLYGAADYSSVAGAPTRDSSGNWAYAAAPNPAPPMGQTGPMTAGGTSAPVLNWDGSWTPSGMAFGGPVSPFRRGGHVQRYAGGGLSNPFRRAGRNVADYLRR